MINLFLLIFIFITMNTTLQTIYHDMQGSSPAGLTPPWRYRIMKAE